MHTRWTVVIVMTLILWLFSPFIISRSYSVGKDHSSLLTYSYNNQVVVNGLYRIYLPIIGRLTDSFRSGVFGIHGSSQLTGAELDLIAGAGAAWVRDFGISWSAVEAEPGRFDWSALDSTWVRVRLANSRGIRVVEVIHSVPAWARQFPDNGCGPIKQEYLSKFASFVAEVARRARESGAQVQAWEVFNEPDVERSWSSPLACYGDISDEYYGGGDYARVLGAVYPAIKSEDARAWVLIGGLLLDCDPRNPPPNKDCKPSRFLEGILRAGGGSFFDGVSFHAYDYYDPGLRYFNPNWASSFATTGPVLAAKAWFIKQTLADYGIPGKVLINTESAILCGQSGTEDICQAAAFEQTKAAYVVHAFTMAMAEGLKGNIWYSLQGWRGSQLVNGSFEPTLSYQVFQFASRMLANTVFTQQKYMNDNKVIVYDFRRPNGNRVWVLWSRSGGSEQVNLPLQPVASYDYLGNPVSTGLVVSVDFRPIYIELVSSSG
jgi:hypothetical protein